MLTFYCKKRNEAIKKKKVFAYCYKKHCKNHILFRNERKMMNYHNKLIRAQTMVAP